MAGRGRGSQKEQCKAVMEALAKQFPDHAFVVVVAGNGGLSLFSNIIKREDVMDALQRGRDRLVRNEEPDETSEYSEEEPQVPN